MRMGMVRSKIENGYGKSNMEVMRSREFSDIEDGIVERGNGEIEKIYFFPIDNVNAEMMIESANREIERASAT